MRWPLFLRHTVYFHDAILATVTQCIARVTAGLLARGSHAHSSLDFPALQAIRQHADSVSIIACLSVCLSVCHKTWVHFSWLHIADDDDRRLYTNRVTGQWVSEWVGEWDELVRHSTDHWPLTTDWPLVTNNTLEQGTIAPPVFGFAAQFGTMQHKIVAMNNITSLCHSKR